MKTIRSNCFETNSSSTHSVTILSKEKGETACSERPLEKDGVLYPANLRFTIAYREDTRDGYSLYASTTAEKCALLIHHIKSLRDYCYQKSDIEGILVFVINQITSYHGLFKEVNLDTFRDSNFVCSDEDVTYLDEIMRLDKSKRETAMDFFIRNTVMNDDMIIVDSDDSY